MNELMINFSDGHPIYMQIYSFLKSEIISGKIEPGSKLPSKRKLAAHLSVSVNTVDLAYQQLLSEGYIHSRERSGFFAERLNDNVFREPNHNHSTNFEPPQTSFNTLINFSQGNVDLENFPQKAWKKASLAALSDKSAYMLGDSRGELVLRKEISRYLFESRGVQTKPDQIVIGAGTQVLIGAIIQLIGLDETYGIEDPGFHRVRDTLRAWRVKRNFIPVTEEGIDVDYLLNTSSKAVYVTPSHQFPLGSILPVSKRLKLIEWAEKNKAYIIEDDYDGEFRYAGRPIPALQGLDPYGRVIYMGTFSKALIPSMRINYMVLPPMLSKRYNESFSYIKQTVSRLHQDALAHFMKAGDWERHLNRMRKIYRRKQKILLDSIGAYMGNEGEVIGEKSGLHILLKVHKDIPEGELIEKALAKGVKVYPVSVYYENPETAPKSCVMLGYGGLSEQQLEAGIKLLREAWLD